MMTINHSIRRQVLALFSLLSLMLCLPSCNFDFGYVRIHSYDAIAYKDLTDLKPQVMELYDTFSDNHPIDINKIAAVRLKLAQLYEYEKGLGETNADTTAQVKIIQGMFERHIKDRMAKDAEGKDKPWNQTHLNNEKKNIADAFDIAITTEASKNKNQ